MNPARGIMTRRKSITENTKWFLTRRYEEEHKALLSPPTLLDLERQEKIRLENLAKIQTK